MSQKEDDTQLTALLDAVIEDLQEKPHGQVESFEEYVHWIRSRLQTDETLFRSRFVHGYHSLLEELKYEQNSHETRKPNDNHFHEK